MATVSFGGGWERTERLGGRSRWWKIAIASAVGVVAFGWWLLPAKHAAETGVGGAVVHHAPAAGIDAVRGTQAIARCRALLAEAEKKLDAVPAMSAVFQKQERIDGVLQPVNVMDLKVRHEPLSIYMKWREPDQGQEIIWRDGAFDGKILVCPAGWKRKVMRTVKIDPTSDQAMAVSKRPVTNVGIWNFTSRLRHTVDEELMRDPAIEATLTTGDEISGRPVDLFTFVHPGQPTAGGFQRMLIYFDEKLGVPVACEHYRWQAEGNKFVAHLEESYLFRDLDLAAACSDVDFDERNPAYEFTKK